MVFQLIKKIWNQGHPKTPHPEGHSQRQDLRAYARYQLWHGEILKAIDAKGKPLEIVDISYGGIAFSKASIQKLANVDRITLFAAGREQLIFTQLAYKGRDKIGFTFAHDNPDSLLFLQRFIELMRCGMTMRRLAPETTNEVNVTANNFIWMGDGPTYLNIDDKTKTLTLREGHFYFTIEITHDGKITTLKTDTKDANAATYSRDEATPDPKPDREVLTKGLFLLSSICDKDCQKIVKPMVELISNFLKTKSISRN